MTNLVPTPTDPDRQPRIREFATLTEALDAAEGGLAGLNFHSSRGDLAEVLSYTDLAHQAREVGSRLLALGLEPGARVGVLAETHGDFLRGFMGALYAGLAPCPMPLPAAFGSRDGYGLQIQRIVEVADPGAVLVPDEYLDWVVPAMEPFGLAYVGPISGLPPKGPPAEGGGSPDDLAYLQFSSGTTGAPKGVAVTHRGLMANLAGMGHDALNVSGADRGVSWLPFYHDMGLVGCVLMPMAAHLSIDYLATRDFIRRPGLWPAMISRAGATMTYAPSFGYELAARRGRAAEGLNLAQWRIAGIGGDMIRAGNLADFSQAYAPFGFNPDSYLPSYGMAELTLGLTFTALGSGARMHALDPDALEEGRVKPAPGDGRAREFAICGKPLDGHDISVRLPDGSEAPEGAVGQIFARGPSVMQGYFRNPEATAEILEAGGWLDTGDLGFLDENGELTLTGRAKDLIIVNGRNIWPQDIEWTVETNLNGIREGGVVAFGATTSHETEQEQLTVVIECRKGDAEARAELTRQADALVREVYQLSPVVALSRPGALPRTSSGKLSRSKAREMYLSGAFGP